MKKNAVIFDLDGTMWNACEPVLISWNVVLRRHGLPAVKKETIESFMGKTLGQIVSLYFTDMTQEEGLKIANECVREEANYLAAHGAALYDGLADTLRQLAQRYELCLVSNCEAGYAEAFLSYHKFEPLFTDYEYSGRTKKSKGENIRMVMERNGIAKAVYVGDTQSDCDAARQAGIPFIFASYGFGSVDSADAAVADIREVPAAAEAVFDKI
ncbi:MAG TPA: HAD family hydrolase [Candidatus Aphodoplasma excrementigallinarum]|uniref:HAD family hydrolase n=1 Tax=Candidatus Aphodoplasma excrementigallinarum TaxID=2840673 RepID=A0A9D1NG72_9FIRM|nr:HAD family hydrolase [Candidatus Aphodoplasma excrementigallinarum]